MKMNNNQKGFTLIELSVVLLIIAIIVGAIASSTGVVKRANLSAARQMTSNSPVVHIDGLSLWLETSLKDSVEYNTSDNVTRWDDISGNGRSLTASSNYPVFVNDGGILNGVPTVKFNGTASISYSDPIPAERNTVFVVARVTNGSYSQNLFYNGNDVSNGYGIVRKSGSSGNIAFAHNGSEVDIAQHDDTGGVFVIKYNGTNGYGKTNNSSSWALNSSMSVSFPASGSIVVGGSNMVNAEIAEVIVYDRDLFDSEVNDVVEYLIKKYNLD